MTRLLALLLLGPAALAGCLDSCPYTVHGIESVGEAAAGFGVQNATRAEQALAALGFAARREGLVVQGERDGILLQLSPANRTTAAVQAWDESVRGEFRTSQAAERFVRMRLEDAAARIGSAVARVEAELGWPFTMRPAEGVKSIC